MEPGKGMYIVLVGWGYVCRHTDVVFTALIPTPPLPPSPPPPPNPPPVPPYYYADRFQSPTGGYQDCCSINNDPHIYPFRRGPGGAYVYSHLICNIDGNFLIAENDFFIIHGRGKSNPEWRNRGDSVVQSVNITYKDPTCGEFALSALQWQLRQR
ncbi:hypothetical protein DUNSADRAFT_3319 [Dunaliella salina]|uniref:Encoded protein n=1 Tax=Dunaliella salina TaxID=3046 RepID=A0ABQ7FVJ0_DUNSA|nr:hypothetical protein DUNSADRAFT_3319 [Dunaliella salina]|eukprot:KAF5826395.1 hypothetical protein DUNSADRAFT_3319 [Dunaliella salina]